MLDIGFQLRLGAETFYIDQKWDPLLPVHINGQVIDNVSYNQMYDMPQIYGGTPSDLSRWPHSPLLYSEPQMGDMGDSPKDIHLIERIPEVIQLSQSGNAKLQYFQLFYMFNDFTEFGGHPHSPLLYGSE